ncbi:MAG: hypothetical protein PHT95_00765 [Candidatus Omnitrophica bacterium]|nr:hypothetical protein [Candidatus Omnitrophota bacterium]MDD4012881.1 hypothetical protein [Candidatus Omnitrophota bacterium]
MGESRGNNTSACWYHEPWVVFMALVLLGPIALPLVWGRPGIPLFVKAFITVTVTILMLGALIGSAKYIGVILEQYRELTEAMK